MLDSRLLHAFVAVAETLHFGRAADRLDLAQSVLSRHIQELERELGTRLLHRSRRSAVSLTDAGVALLAESRTALAQLDRAAVAARRAGRGEVGRLAIGYVASAALSGILPQWLGRFRLARPEVAIELSPLDTPRQLAALADGSIDLACVRPRSAYPDGVEARIVHREDLLLAVSTQHRLAHGRVTAAALAGERVVLPQFDEHDGFEGHLAALALHGRFTPGPVLRVRDFMTAITLAIAGYGVALVPRSVTALALSGVTYRPIDDGTATAELAIAWRRNNASAALRALIERLRPATEA
jgi:LysR family transcriptional regulator, benzoate and cis,cis-muconate-responsive activator of ben and cat genes